MDESHSKICPASGDHQARIRPFVPNHWWSITRQWWTPVPLERYLTINTLQRRYRYGNKTTIKAAPMARRKKQAHIYTYPQGLTRGTETLVHTHWYSNASFLILAILTLTLEALWQALHQWPTLLSFTINFLRIRLAMDDSTLDDHFDWRFEHH